MVRVPGLYPVSSEFESLRAYQFKEQWRSLVYRGGLQNRYPQVQLLSAPPLLYANKHWYVASLHKRLQDSSILSIGTNP